MKNRILTLILLLVMMLGIVGCEMGGTTEPDPKPDPGQTDLSGRVVTDDELKTPYTDQLKLTQSYVGKSFINDGIGVVTLSSPVDGDTAIFKEGSTTFTARFNAVNTPESTYKLEPWGLGASKFTKRILNNAYKIVLQADTIKTNRLDSTGKRYLAWVWYQPFEGADFRLLNLEIIEKCYSTSKASGMLYADTLLDADLQAQKLNVRIWNRTVLDPDYDYSETGKYLTLKEIREKYSGYTESHEKVIVKGIVTRKIGPYSAYIQQQEDGVWYIGSTMLVDGDGEPIKAVDENPDMPFVGENGNWFIGELNTGMAAAGGIAGQSLYDYYKAGEESPLSEAEWIPTLTVTEADASINHPYIVKDGEWYGVYLYGGFTGISSKLTIGQEVKVAGNIGTFYGALQITGVTADGIAVLNKEITNPHVYDIEDVSSLSVNGSTQLFGCLVELHDLTVYSGYNTKTSDAFTLKCQDAHGNKINIRVDGNTAIHQYKTGEKIHVADATNTTAAKEYYPDGALDDDATGIVNCWQYFDGKTFSSIKGILTVYDGDTDGTPELQVMLTLVKDIVFDVE